MALGICRQRAYIVASRAYHLPNPKNIPVWTVLGQKCTASSRVRQGGVSNHNRLERIAVLPGVRVPAGEKISFRVDRHIPNIWRLIWISTAATLKRFFLYPEIGHGANPAQISVGVVTRQGARVLAKRYLVGFSLAEYGAFPETTAEICISMTIHGKDIWFPVVKSTIGTNSA